MTRARGHQVVAWLLSTGSNSQAVAVIEHTTPPHPFYCLQREHTCDGLSEQQVLFATVAPNPVTDTSQEKGGLHPTFLTTRVYIQQLVFTLAPLLLNGSFTLKIWFLKLQSLSFPLSLEISSTSTL